MYLVNLLKKDQKARKSIFNKWKKIVYIDSINYLKLSNIVSEKFYPGYQTIGTYLSYDITSILLLHIHFPNYENVIKNGLIKGELSPNMAAYIYVRQYKYLYPSICPILPSFISDIYVKYTGLRYKKALKKGYKFSSFL